MPFFNGSFGSLLAAVVGCELVAQVLFVDLFALALAFRSSCVGLPEP